MKKITSILLIVSLIFTMIPFMEGASKSYAASGDTYTLNLSGTFDYATGHEMIKDINSARSDAGLSSLQLDKDLTNYAMQRAAELAYYYSHTRPNRTECYTLNTSRLSAENIAYGFTSGSSVFEGWMNSKGHKENILCQTGKAVGIGHVVHLGRHYWVQLFSNKTGTTETRTNTATETRSISIKETSYQLCFQDFNHPGSETLAMQVNDTYALSVHAANQGLLEAEPDPILGYCTFDADSFNWTSGNSSIATVSSKGVVSAKGVGSTNITATSKIGGRKVVIKVNVTKNLANATVSKISDRTYTGSAIKPKVTVKYSDVTLSEDRDYTVSYADNINTGYASVTIKGIGEYTGTITEYFYINRRDISKTVKATLKKWNYQGYSSVSGFMKDNLIITYNGKTLKDSVDYNVYPSCDENNKRITSYNVYFTGNYNGGIFAKSLEDAIISSIPLQFYTGKAIKPKLEVYTSCYTYYLEENKDYKLQYKNNIEGGTATVTLVPLGNNYGKAKTTFKIQYPKYTVKFNGNKGKVTETSKTVTVKSKYGTLPKAKRTGYKFAGWYTKKSGGTRIKSTTICKLKGNQTLYAHWTKVKVDKAVIKSVKRLSGKKLKVTVKKDSTVKGYQIKIATNKKFTKNVKTASIKGTVKTFKNLKKTKYYVKVREYKIDSAGKRVYGAYSKVKTIKIR